MFVLRKDGVLENILQLVNKQMQGAPIIGAIVIAKTVLTALKKKKKKKLWYGFLDILRQVSRNCHQQGLWRWCLASFDLLELILFEESFCVNKLIRSLEQILVFPLKQDIASKTKKIQ